MTSPLQSFLQFEPNSLNVTIDLSLNTETHSELSTDKLGRGRGHQVCRYLLLLVDQRRSEGNDVSCTQRDNQSEIRKTDI